MLPKKLFAYKSYNMYEQDLALNNIYGLIYHKTKLTNHYLVFCSIYSALVYHGYANIDPCWVGTRQNIFKQPYDGVPKWVDQK